MIGGIRTATMRAAWGTAGVAGAVLASQIIQARFRVTARFRIIPVAQSFTPVLMVGGLPVALVGLMYRRRALVSSAVVVSAGLGALVAPALARGRTSGRNAPADTLTVAHANLLFRNVELAPDAMAAMLATDADVLAMSEYTPVHRAALERLVPADDYPFRLDRPANTSGGLAIWSRFPLADTDIRMMMSRPGASATVMTDSGPVRIVLAHPDPPTTRSGLRHWAPSLEMIDAVASSPGPATLIVGDVNAARWHPEFRRLLRSGWRDAHEQVGRGLRPSWPMDGLVLPPLLRLDHALTREGLTTHDVRDFSIPGSDHLGFIVTVSRDASSVPPDA